VERFTLDVEVRVDDPATIVGHRYAPDTGSAAAPLLVCIPGGSYNHRYWDLDVPGARYSFAREMVALGYQVVAIDNLGTGESSRPTHEPGLAELGAGAAAVIADLRRRLPPGTPVVGVGHSMGGFALVVLQATFASCDAVAILGSPIGTSPSVPLPAELVEAASTGPERRAEISVTLAGQFPEPYTPGNRDAVTSLFHLDDVPNDVLVADEQQCMTDVPRRAAAQTITPWFTVEEAAAIDAPVLLAFGDHDLLTKPHDQPGYYSGSRDVTLFVLPGAAHCHNMANTRGVLWGRIDRWVRSAL
jgi:pimeloyl-ACP methyl ester carboxylesterase